MVITTEIENRVKRLNEKFVGYIPPRDRWTPVDESVCRPADPLRVSMDEAQAMQFKAIKYAFTRQYSFNKFYHRLCDNRGVTPDDLKTNEDLEKVPLIPDSTFKTHPSGEDFAHWIANVYTGELPTVVIDTANPTFDDVINAFNAAGLEVAYSTGTTGRHSVIPRDKKTFWTFQYSMTKMRASLWDELGWDHSLSLFPRPTQTNLYAGKATTFQKLIYKDHHFALDFEITADLALRAMAGKDRQGSAPQSAEDMVRKIYENGSDWLERYENTTDTLGIVSPPAVFMGFLSTLERAGKRFEFGERLTLATGGGWKTRDNERIEPAGFRKRVEEILGVPETNCLDGYGMVEMNAGFLTCPEGHYYHIPETTLKPVILDKNLMPAGYGESGRFAFLDALAGSYPGFIITGDTARLLEHCPACDRTGPVLDQGIGRASSEEVRGCAEEMRTIFEQDLAGSAK
jgi:phenylacetate-coenzyme A ligase PaaK-like adenylate-forming protein